MQYNSIEKVLLEDAKGILLSSPKDILIRAADQTKVIGSSTCCLVTLDPTAEILHAANLGDSGFLLMRKMDRNLAIIARSTEQCHGFNFPFQVG